MGGSSIQFEKYWRRYDYQFLDEMVAPASLKSGRNEKGSFTFPCHYRFEFSLDGYSQYSGMADLVGYQLYSIHLDHLEGTRPKI